MAVPSTGGLVAGEHVAALLWLARQLLDLNCSIGVEELGGAMVLVWIEHRRRRRIDLGLGEPPHRLELLLRRVQLHADLLAAAFLFLSTTPTREGGREGGEGKN